MGFFFLGQEGEREAGPVTEGESQGGVGEEEGAVDPVSERGRQEEKGKVATRDCNMSAVMFLRHTAVILEKRSSSHPCGLGLETPNLSAASSTWQHAAVQGFTMLQQL